MNFDNAIIIAPGLEQRISKMVFSFLKNGITVKVIAEEIAVKGEFDNYLGNVEFVEIPVGESKLRRTPFGCKRKKLITQQLKEATNRTGNTLVVARDVNYGYIVGGIVKKLRSDKLLFITDVADNYDLLYDSYSNLLISAAIKFGFGHITKNAFRYSDALIAVSPINEPRIRKAYRKQAETKPILLLRNLPIEFRYLHCEDKLPNSFVYVGKIDETSRDPFYVLEKMLQMPEYTLHFYSSQKKQTLDRIRAYADEHGIGERVIFHERVPYDKLAVEISRYSFGLVPHKRSLITDFTLPNKMYDYKSSGIVSIMSDCPSLVAENDEFGFGVIYSKEKDDFADAVNRAEQYTLDTSVNIPIWEKSFDEMLEELKKI